MQNLLKSIGAFLLCCQLAVAQDSLNYELKEIVITGPKEAHRNETALNIQPVKTISMLAKGSFNIADGLSREPGITQLSTGPAITKPVIRGLFGNRVLVLLSGLRFDNQQWQDEHGLGLSDIGISKVEVIRGPVSVLYGTEAIGGLLNVIDEEKAAVGKMESDANLRFHSSTLGFLIHAGLKANNGKLWWKVRTGAESHADYASGDNVRVLNSRNKGYYFKGSVGFKRKNVESENRYSFSLNDYGFIMDDILSFMDVDDRYTRKLNGPFHQVMLNIVSSQNHIQLKNSLLKIDAGFQSNSRMENEGGGKISLNMLLTSVLYKAEWQKQLNTKTELIISNNGSYENNTNFGSRKIIPDAHMIEENVAAFVKYKSGILVFEAGGAVNDRFIKTLLTPLVNTPAKGTEITPFNRNHFGGNGLLGISLNPGKGFNTKLSVSTGLRAPNLAELSSNGLREGTYRYEIGDMSLTNEKNLNMDISFSQQQKWFGYSFSGFVNLFDNFIYLAPTDEEYLGFNVYRYRQKNALYTGTDGEAELTPQGVLKGLALRLAWSFVYAVDKQGAYLPFVPAGKISPSLKYTTTLNNKVAQLYASVGVDYVFAQNRIAENELATPSYYLLNATIGCDFTIGKQRISVNIAGNNLLDAAYYDHLSRLKDYGINNMGRDIFLNVSIPFSFNYQTKNKN